MSNTETRSNHWPASHINLEPEELLRLYNTLLPIFKKILSHEQIALNQELLTTFKNTYIPFCAWLVDQNKNKPLVIGINGAQGSGKSTLTKIINELLEQGFDKKVVYFSIDDLYLKKYQRLKLAHDIHPLFETRGVPGTHNAELGISILKHLLEKTPSEVLIPVFDKAIDDQLAESDWTRFNGICDIIILEGWCVGSKAQDETELELPVNKLEEEDDPDSIWRSYVNNQLKDTYADLFSLIDILIMLKIPDFSKIYKWRKLQEKKLKQSITKHQKATNKIMSDSEIDRFIMHYERITRFTLDEMPARSDVVFELDDKHLIKKIVTKIKD